MKRILLVAGFLVLAAQLPLWGYDSSPSHIQIIPEVIWAAATGGGTWVTELQITNLSSFELYVGLRFDTAAGSAGTILIGPIAAANSVKYSNILDTMDALDGSGWVYYGNVGGLVVCETSLTGLIQVQAKTVNGNYGKTFPGLNVVAGNTAAEGRPVIIQDIVRSSAYRTSVGVYNSNDTEFTADFWVIDAAGETVGSSFSKTIPAYGFLSFNPFTQAGITSGTYENCLLYVEVSSGSSASYGLMLYGSLANNYSNDTCALLAKQYGSAPSLLPPPFRR